jgi:hypothetical protein
MEAIISKTQRQVYNERSKMRKTLREVVLTCCQNAWLIPTDEMKTQILLHMGWQEIEIEHHYLNFMSGGMTQEEIAEMKHIELNTLLASSYYMAKCEQDGLFDEYEEIVQDVLDEFTNN